MTTRGRWILAGLVAIVVLSIAVALVVLSARRPSPDAQGFVQYVFGRLEAGFLAAQAARESADVIVRRDEQGRIKVSGRAVSTTREVDSIEDLPMLLRDLRSPGTAVLVVSYRSSSPNALLESPPPIVQAAARRIQAVLTTQGFSVLPGGYQVEIVRGEASGRGEAGAASPAQPSAAPGDPSPRKPASPGA